MTDSDDAYAVITAGRRRAVLRPGQVLTIGRGSAADLRIGHEPVDLRVPRALARLEGRGDGVLITNTSDKRTITVEVWPGPEFEVAPLSMAGTAPHELVTLVVHGTAGARHAVTVDATRLRGSSPARDAPGEQPTVGFERLGWITPHQRQLLCALVLPAHRGWNGRTSTPTYAEMEAVLRERGFRATAKTVRNTFDELRLRIALDHDVYDLHSDGPSGPGGAPASYLPAFAQWVWLSGNVTADELEAFDALADVRGGPAPTSGDDPARPGTDPS